MFDRNRFSKILSEINSTYNTMTEFAEKASFDRTYISKYINKKLKNPPSPKILEKIANASNDIVSYTELMIICGYIQNKEFKQSFEKIKKMEDNLNEDLQELNLSDIEEKYYKEYFLKLCDLIFNKNTDINVALTEIEKNVQNNIPKNISADKIIKAVKLNLNFLIVDSHLYESDDILLKKYNYSEEPKFYMCPVYGQISAGIPNWAEECIEGRLPIDPNMMNIVDPEECFFLRVNGESMNKLVRNGAYALIRKTDWVENGEVAVVLVNGFDATLKKFSKQGDLVVLEPMSNDSSFQVQIYDKNTPIKILGKYIGKFEMK